VVFRYTTDNVVVVVGMGGVSQHSPWSLRAGGSTLE
jgi:hypothetical protein